MRPIKAHVETIFPPQCLAKQFLTLERHECLFLFKNNYNVVSQFNYNFGNVIQEEDYDFLK